jgi:hypothetical protein
MHTRQATFQNVALYRTVSKPSSQSFFAPQITANLHGDALAVHVRQIKCFARFFNASTIDTCASDCNTRERIAFSRAFAGYWRDSLKVLICLRPQLFETVFVGARITSRMYAF